MRPATTFASVTVGSVPPRPYEAGPGCEPALRGPTLRRPISSTSAMLPPPAPISISSMVEMRMGRPLPSMKRRCLAASKLYAVSGSPPSTSDSLAVVPPMSKASTLPPLSSRPKKAAAMAAAAAAVGEHTLGHLPPQVARDEGLGLGDGKIVELVLPLAPDLQGVGEALGGDEPGD